MLNRKRTTFEIAVFTDLAELPQLMVHGTHQLHQGFEYKGMLLLNDSLTEGETQDYAVVRKADMVQVDSLTVWWERTTPRQLRDLLELYHRNLHEADYWPLHERLWNLKLTYS